jgi:protein subunit release factor B
VGLSRDDYLRMDDADMLAQSTVDKYRARGPGGQKRNKTDSAVRIRHHPTELIAIAVESRSQHQNRAKAIKRLRQMIALHVRVAIDLPTYKPSETMAECIVRGQQLQVGRRDRRYNLVAAEVLDLIVATKGRLSESAEALGVSTGNLSKFIAKDLKLKARVNEIRKAEGIGNIR